MGYSLEHRKATLSNVDWMNNPNRMSVLYPGEAYRYGLLFPTMITNWRKDWGQGGFPFLFVQLAPGGPLQCASAGSTARM